jgi:hypothetical protein
MCKTVPSQLLQVLERGGPAHIVTLQAPVVPPDDYLSNLIELADKIGVELTVGSIVVSDDATPSGLTVELEALEAFTSYGAEMGVYFDSDAITNLFILPCFSATVPCTTEDCPKCGGVGGGMARFLEPPVYWTKKGK